VIEALRPNRIGNASSPPRARVDDRRLRETGIVLEICPTLESADEGDLPTRRPFADVFRAFIENGPCASRSRPSGPQMMRTHLRDEFELLHSHRRARRGRAAGGERAAGTRRASRRGARPVPSSRRSGKLRPSAEVPHALAVLASLHWSKLDVRAPGDHRTPAAGRRANRGGLLERGGRRAASGISPRTAKAHWRRPAAEARVSPGVRSPSASQADRRRSSLPSSVTCGGPRGLTSRRRLTRSSFRAAPDQDGRAGSAGAAVRAPTRRRRPGGSAALQCGRSKADSAAPTWRPCRLCRRGVLNADSAAPTLEAVPLCRRGCPKPRSTVSRACVVTRRGENDS